MRYTADGQEDKQITIGDEVVVAYAAGDADTGTVTGTVEPNGVYVQIEGKSEPKLFHVDSVSKLEGDDVDDLIAEHDRREHAEDVFVDCPKCSGEWDVITARSDATCYGIETCRWPVSHGHVRHAMPDAKPLAAQEGRHNMARTKKQPEQYAIRADQIVRLDAAELLDMLRYAQATSDGTIERDRTTYFLFTSATTDLYALARYFARWRSFGCEPMKLDARYGTIERPYTTNAIGWPV